MRCRICTRWMAEGKVRIHAKDTASSEVYVEFFDQKKRYGAVTNEVQGFYCKYCGFFAALFYPEPPKIEKICPDCNARMDVCFSVCENCGHVFLEDE